MCVCIEVLSEEKDNEKTTNSLRAHLELGDKIWVEYLNDLLEKYDFDKHKNILFWNKLLYVIRILVYFLIKIQKIRAMESS